MKQINIYHTHIEIYPYHLGECEKLEKMCSYYNPVTHSRVYIACVYDEENEKLIIPRGVSQVMLKSLFNTVPNVISECNNVRRTTKRYKMLVSPKDQTQETAINFLMHKDEFLKTSYNSQFGLNLDTGYGKTYCMVNAIVQFQTVSMIITNQDTIKSQWKETFLKMTDVPEEKIINIEGSSDMELIRKEKLSGDVYLVNHQTLTSYIKSHGEDYLNDVFEIAGIGIKVYDEAHKCFRSILTVDMYTDVQQTYYLTATFERTDPKEATVFKRAFASLSRYGEGIEKRKHVIYNIVFFNSNASNLDNVRMQTNYGFSNYRYWNYCYNIDKDQTILYALQKVVKKALEEDGKILITSPMIDSADYITNILSEAYPELLVSSIHSKKHKEENEYNKNNANIISTTIKSLGTGADISEIRTIINIDPHSSATMTKQLIGRLREYAPDKDTYFYDLIDVSFGAIVKMIEKRTPVIIKKCKNIIRYKLF